MKYFIYCRKSSESEDRQVLSIESQTRELIGVAKKHELQIVRTISESKSAKNLGRPGFGELISFIETGEINSILVWHPDRLSRNPQDAATIISLMDSGKLLEVRTPTQTFRNNPMDKFMLGFFMMQAKFENDHKGENVKEGLKTKAEKGWLPSGAKPGYMNDKFAEKGNKTIKEDPDRFPLIRKCWDLMLTGAYTPPAILERLNNEWGYRTPVRKSIGGKPMCRSQIYRMFMDPFYYGLFEFPVGGGLWFKGNHKPMITKVEFERVQMFLKRKGSPKPHTREFSFTGVMACGECGAMITAEEKWQTICAHCKQKFASINRDRCPKCQTTIQSMNDPTILHYIYYHCTKRKNKNCTQGCVHLKDIETQIDTILSRINISEEFKNWAIKYLNELNEQEVTDRNATLSSLQNSYNLCVNEMDNLLKLKISPQNSDGSLLSDEEFKAKKLTLTQEKTALEERLKNTSLRIDKWMEDAEKAFNFAVHARYWFEHGTLQEKREILITIGSNLKLFNKLLRLDVERPYEYFIEIVKHEPTTSALFEPKKQSLTTEQLEAIWTQNPLVLPRVDSNHEP